jgi:signal transduction histidine kinase
LWSCVFDPAQVSQVIDNLVINAVQAMPTGGSIEIVARNIAFKEGDIPTLAAGPFVKIHIRDTGSGIPPALLQRIFDPFFTTKQTGNGLGLATAYSIVKRHDGTILVDSQPGYGTTFTLYFPAAPALAAAPATRQVPSQQGRGSILVMDDERALLDVTTKFLASLGLATRY